MSPDERIRKKYDLSPPSGTFTCPAQLGDPFRAFQIGDSGRDRGDRHRPGEDRQQAALSPL